MTFSLVKTAAIAATLVVASVSAASAATWAYVDQDSKVRLNHYNGSPTVGWVDEGDVVKVINHWGNWYRIDPPGPNNAGWVRSYVLDFDYEDDPSKPGVQFCFYNGFAKVCLNS
ncbi:MAG TPA: hypothetical protein VG757_03970 [Devosia sp.]|nr:hypothetical protein [Devosia sp.]